MHGKQSCSANHGDPIQSAGLCRSSVNVWSIDDANPCEKLTRQQDTLVKQIANGKNRLHNIPDDSGVRLGLISDINGKPKCGSDDIKNFGYSKHNEPCYFGCNDECEAKSFIPKYRYKAYEPDVKEKVVDMAINGSGIKDTRWVLVINKKTVINTLKKGNGLVQANPDIQKNTQKKERKNLNVRTWIKHLSRKTMCFSKQGGVQNAKLLQNILQGRKVLEFKNFLPSSLRTLFSDSLLPDVATH